MAKSDIGTITILLEAKGQQFDASMKKATKDVGKFQASVKAATGKMSVAWTSMQSKISLVTGGMELAFKSASSFGKLFAGDMEGAVDGLKSLPLGIGAVVSAMEGAIGYFTGWTAAIKESEAAIKDMEASTRRMQDAWNNRVEIGKLSQEFAKDTSPEKERIDRQSASESGNLRIDEFLNVKSIESERLLVVEAINKAYGLGNITQGKQIEYLNAASRAAAKRVEYARAYFKTLQDQLEVSKQASYILSQGSKRQEQIETNAKHQLTLMRIQGASEEDILKTKLKRHDDIAKSLDGELRRLKLINAENSKILEKQKEIADHAESGKRSLEISLAGKLAEKKNLDNQPPGAVASSFSTAVGQIVLPDARQSGENRRAQLEELKKINGSIAQLNSSLASARAIYP